MSKWPTLVPDPLFIESLNLLAEWLEGFDFEVFRCHRRGDHYCDFTSYPHLSGKYAFAHRPFVGTEMGNRFVKLYVLSGNVVVMTISHNATIKIDLRNPLCFVELEKGLWDSHLLPRCDPLYE